VIPVDWDTTYAREIPHQTAWTFATIQRVPSDLRAIILSKDGQPTSVAARDPLFDEVASLLGWKGQAILYGPPGTGKTYMARRFAVWWLLAALSETEADEALANPSQFRQAERELSTAQFLPLLLRPLSSRRSPVTR
jgi:5-methylcytosine-specific restriction protein B